MMKYSTNLSNIATALCKVQAEIKNPIKNNANKGVMGSPKYANLEDTLEDYVRPVLTKHGMSFFQSVKSNEQGHAGVSTTLFHESGEYIEGDFVYCETKIPISNAGKEILTVGQATGVNITYLRRYSLNSALGINGDKDTDGSYGDYDKPKAEPKVDTTTIEERKSNVKIKLEVLADIKKISVDEVKKAVIDKAKADESTVEGLIKIEALLAHWITQASAKDDK